MCSSDLRRIRYVDMGVTGSAQYRRHCHCKPLNLSYHVIFVFCFSFILSAVSPPARYLSAANPPLLSSCHSLPARTVCIPTAAHNCARNPHGFRQETCSCRSLPKLRYASCRNGCVHAPHKVCTPHRNRKCDSCARRIPDKYDRKIYIQIGRASCRERV